MLVKANSLRTQTFLQDFATIYKNIDGISEGKGFRSPVASDRLKDGELLYAERQFLAEQKVEGRADNSVWRRSTPAPRPLCIERP